MILQLEEAKQRLLALKQAAEELKKTLDIDRISKRAAELEAQTYTEGFWGGPNTQEVLTSLKNAKRILEDYSSLSNGIHSLESIVDLAIEEDDESLTAEILGELSLLAKSYDRQNIESLLSGEFDTNNAILAIHPGAGGTEAQDWAEMLYRMYCRWAEKNSFKVKVLDYLDGDEAGLKSVTFLIEGQHAYGFLRSEAGVHRLVRVSPFDSSGRRHTSFASVEIMPEFTDDINIDLREEDLKMETHRSSGAGGQHVNKTDSAVRITHIPTGITVGCQTERSQLQNRETCMKMLKSRLMEIKQREKLDRIEDIKGEKLNIEWGSQIRSYVFMPYTLVKDNRTGHEDGNISAVMDGNIDEFINAYLKAKRVHMK